MTSLPATALPLPPAIFAQRRQAARHTGRLLLRALRESGNTEVNADDGQVPPAALAALQERIAGARQAGQDLLWGAHLDDDDAVDVVARLLAHRATETIPSRVHDAIAADRGAVRLEDESTLERDDAERQLAQREEQRVFLPLRRALERSRPHAATLEGWWTTTTTEAALGLSTSQLTTSGQVGTFLDRFVDDTAASGDACFEALVHEGRVAFDGTPHALNRLLDLPLPGVTHDGALVDVVRVGRVCCPDRQQPAFKRQRAPRTLHGHVVVDDDTARLLLAPVHGLRRFNDGLAGVANLLCAGLPPRQMSHNQDGGDHAFEAITRRVDGLQGALALALAAPPIHRVLGLSAAEAARLWRLSVARQLVWARLEAVVCRAADVVEADPEAPLAEQLQQRLAGIRGNVATRLNLQVDDALLATLLAPLWPNGEVLATDAHLRALRALNGAACLWSFAALREALDDGFVLRRHSLEALVDPDSRQALLPNLLPAIFETTTVTPSADGSSHPSNRSSKGKPLEAPSRDAAAKATAPVPTARWRQCLAATNDVVGDALS